MSNNKEAGFKDLGPLLQVRMKPRVSLSACFPPNAKNFIKRDRKEPKKHLYWVWFLHAIITGIVRAVSKSQVFGTCQRKKRIYFWKSMFPGVHWSWKLWEVIVRRAAAAPEAEWKSGAGGGCCAWPMPGDRLLVSGQEFHNRRFLPALFRHLSYFCQYETKKNSTSLKILHFKCIPLTTLHKMWSQFLFLFLSMKVEPGSLNFCLMERARFVALFPFSIPAQTGAWYPTESPKQWPCSGIVVVWLQRGQRLLLTVGGVIVGSWNL